jgi:hypothetical protein
MEVSFPVQRRQALADIVQLFTSNVDFTIREKDARIGHIKPIGK